MPAQRKPPVDQKRRPSPETQPLSKSPKWRSPFQYGRRQWIKAGAVLVAVGVPIGAVFSRTRREEASSELVKDPHGILDLRPEFSYRLLEQAGQKMDDGYVVPGRPDGMACFTDRQGRWVLMRNHENYFTEFDFGPYPSPASAPREAYDRNAPGGVSRVVIDPETHERISSNLVLAGTLRNCASGTSPYGYLTCEEAIDPGHGYVFLCDPNAESVQPAVRIAPFGRFNHEAALVDPKTGIAYLTEDRGDGAFYRFVPADKSKPFIGRLQALRIPGSPRKDLATGLRVGSRLPIEWVDIPEPEPVEDTVRLQAHAAEAAIFRRGEGLHFANETIYISSTSGGPADAGQIFGLTARGDGGELTLLAQSESPEDLDMPDNICVSPTGAIYMAEDGLAGNSLRVLRPDGRILELARNARSPSELTGVCFSPDGRVLFANLQTDGLTLAIEGPFDRLARG